MKKTHYTYKITDPVNGEYYIGVRTCEGKPENDSYMGSYCSWNPEDENRLEKEILGIYPTRPIANSFERKLQILALKVHRDPKCMNGYITRLGFCNHGRSFSEEHCRKISQANKGKHSHRKGTTLKEDHKRKISKGNQGKIRSEDAKRKVSQGLKKYYKTNGHHSTGIPKSEETKRKISETLKCRKLSKETRERMSKGQKGKKLSEEHKRKLSKAHKGKSKSKEHRKNLSKALSGVVRPSRRKPVIQMDKDGNFIKQWASISKASIELKIRNIGSVCQGNRKTAGGFIWRYVKS